MLYENLFNRLRESSLFKDSFWAVFGNGIGNFLLLLSGILIARLLGKDLFGEYGMVKTTMFTIATFSTLSLNTTSTKFIAEFLQKDISSVKSIIRTSLRIVLSFSLLMCIVLFLFSHQIAVFVNEPQLSTSFKVLGVIILFRAFNTIGAGILGGFKDFRRVGINNIIAGVIMFGLCIPLTKVYGLHGAYASLLSSQLALCILNMYYVFQRQGQIKNYSNKSYGRTILKFTYPFALNEFVYTFTAWGSSLALTKYASLGDLGMYTACMQWNSVILFMPGLLANVILSYLSSSVLFDSKKHNSLIKKMLLINLISTLIPFTIVAVLSPYISAYYGKSFEGMNVILLIAIWATIFTCLSRVFESNLMSEGRRWTAFCICSSIYILSFASQVVVLKLTNGENAAMNMIMLSVFFNALSFVVYSIEYNCRHLSLKTAKA